MKKQAFNPYLPSYEYIPDGEPYVYNDRIYIFGSHDKFNGKNFCQNKNYVLWSAPIDELWNWKCHGVIYKTSQDPDAKNGKFMQAPDMIQGPDGRYYLYYTLSLAPFMSVAVSDTLEGPYNYYGKVRRKDGTVIGGRLHELFQFDPALFKDDDGRIYLFSGFAPRKKGPLGFVHLYYKFDGAYVMELESDMLTVKYEPCAIIPMADNSKGTGFEGHEFYEASSMRKIDGKYYFIYSSILSHELCYAVSDRPDGNFKYGGTLISIGDVGLNGRKKEHALNYLGNTHGSLVNIKGQWYVFYHRHTNQHMYSRQGCAEKISIDENGTINQVEVTSCGLNEKPLDGSGKYSAHIACNLMSEKGVVMYGRSKKKAKAHPYFTQSGTDREYSPDQYIANMKNGARAGFKYFDFDGLKEIRIKVSGDAEGVMFVSTRLDGDAICKIPVATADSRVWCCARTDSLTGTYPLYFKFSGEGTLNFHEFELIR